MSDERSNPEQHRNIWAPWRMEYIASLGGDDDECFLCHDRDHPGDDEKNLVLWRGSKTFAVLNRFPYTGGHMLVAPYDHVPDLDALDDGAMVEMMKFLRDLQKILARGIGAQGFNIGMNLGRCAGAGLPGHLHVHIVPRWAGDTNFMPVFGDVHVIPESLEKLYRLLRATGDELSLPNLST